MVYFLLIAFSILLSLSSNAYTATYWVAKTGSDSRSCTQAQSQSTPKLTINSGLTCLAAGDTLAIKAGTYDETLSNNVHGGTSSNYTIVKAAPNETVIIRGTSEGVLYLDQHARSYISFEGLILDGSNIDGDVVKVTHNGRGEFAHHLRFLNTEVRNAPSGMGIAIGAPSADTSTFHEFIGVNVHHNGLNGCDQGPAFCHGFYMAASNNLVDRSEVHHNSAHGIQSYSEYQRPNNNIIRNSKWYNNGGTALGVYNGENNQVYNNVIYSNGASGLNIFSGNNVAYNNTIYGNANEGLYCRGGASSKVLRNNLTFNNGGGDIVDCSGSTQSNNLTGTAPSGMFVNAPSGDFHLRAGSPAINAGVTVGGVTTDTDGISRPKGAEYDIGAYEFSLGSLPSPANLRLVAR